MGELPTPVSREDKLLHNIINGTPNVDDLVPISREEVYLKHLATNRVVEISQGGTGATTAEKARENLGVFKPYVLYDNSSGTNDTIILSDDSANYEFLEIFYSGDAGVLTSARAPQPYGDAFALFSSNYYKGTGTIHLKCAYVTITDDKIKFDPNATGMMWVRNQELPNVIEDNSILIYRVWGYKY